MVPDPLLKKGGEIVQMTPAARARARGFAAACFTVSHPDSVCAFVWFCGL